MTEKLKMNLLICSMLILTISCSTPDIDYSPGDDYLIMLSLDGFRWDYAERVNTPNLDHIAEKGVKAEYLEPVFPSKTFPNHYTMATGLYPNNHGIVDNNFYCPQLDATYRISDRESIMNGSFYDGEPIWITAEKQNVTSASYYWVGSEASINGIQPTYWKEYDASVPFEDRVDTVINWLELPEEERPRLITFYYNEPDMSGHIFGPASYSVDQKVMYIDSLVGIILSRLSNFPQSYNINLIITSDHGMSAISPERHVDMTDHIDRNWLVKTHGGNPVLNLQPKEKYADTVYNILSNVPNLNTWKREEIPGRFNYGSNPRIMDILVMSDPTWSVGWGSPTGSYYRGGAHGWDHEIKDMQTIFYAIGPVFKQNHQHPPFNVIDLYPLIAHILELEPAEVDGKLENTINMLK